MATLHPMLRPFVPSEGDPFDRIKAAHLLNRAGFGGTEEEIEQVLKLGPADAVDWLFDFPDAGVEEQSRSDLPDLSSIEGYPRDFAELRAKRRGMTPEERQAYQQMLNRANREAVQQTSSWWLKRMANGPHPLQEKLTLFWHGHFTTSAKDERAALLMWNQNELLRRNAVGNFREFVRQISRDPAMLDYLNNQQNRKARPNENYARELMELFTLGIGNYTEADIREAARAFTGWAHDGDEFIFRKFDHDTDNKRFFGRVGNFDGDDIIDIILSHPACSKYITGRFWSHFAYEDPEPQLCESLGQQLREAKWEMRPVLRQLFSSQGFYSSRAIGSQIKSPIQLVIGTIRMLGLGMPPQRVLQASLNQMGQVPLEPPNVKGWPGGRAWINTSTLFVRYNTGLMLLGGGGMQPNRGRRGGSVSLAVHSPETKLTADLSAGSAEAVVDAWIAKLIQRPIEPEKRQVLLGALKSDADDRDAVVNMVQLILSMPEYQLC